MGNIVLLDGGMGQELVHRSKATPTALWSTQVMIDRPDLVEEIHADFFRAGATVATTNSYAVLRDRLEKVGMADRVPELIEIAVRAASCARDAVGGGLIAGAIGPVGASYRPDLCPSPEETAAIYQEQISALSKGVDLLLFETVASVQHAEGAMLAAQGHGLPVWLALSVHDDDGTVLRSGEPLTAVRALFQRQAPDALLINCSPPERIGAALDIIAEFGLPFGAYANGFTRISEAFMGDRPVVDTLERRNDLSPEAYSAFALDWVAKGATIVGGCCEVGPAHIAAMAKDLHDAGHVIT